MGRIRNSSPGVAQGVARVDRERSMFGGGRGFQPAARSSFGYSGRVQVVGGIFSRQQFVGQTPIASPGPVRMGQETAPSPAEKPPKTEFEARPGRRLAWGRLKKADAAELAAQLAQISERMKAAGMPLGVVRELQAKLDSFVATAQPTAEVEITEKEIQEVEAAILALEEAEMEKPSGIPTGLILAGTAVVGILLLSSL